MNRKIVYTILSIILALQPALYYYISPFAGTAHVSQAPIKAQSTPATVKTMPAQTPSKNKSTAKKQNTNEKPITSSAPTENSDAKKIIKPTAPETKTVSEQINTQPEGMRKFAESIKPPKNGPTKQPDWLGSQGKITSVVFPNGAKANKTPSTTPPTQQLKKMPTQPESDDAEKKSKPAAPAAQQATAPELAQEEPAKTEPENAPLADQNAQGGDLMPAKSFHIPTPQSAKKGDATEPLPSAVDATATPLQGAPLATVLPHPQRLRKINLKPKTIKTKKTPTINTKIARSVKPQEIVHSAAPQEVTTVAQHARQQPAAQHVNAMQRVATHEPQPLADSRTINTATTSAQYASEQPRVVANSHALNSPIHEHGLQPTELNIKIVDQILHANGFSRENLPQKCSFTIPNAQGQPIFHIELTPPTYRKAQQTGALDAFIHPEHAEHVSKILAQECSAIRQASLPSAQHADAVIAHTPEAHVQPQAPHAIEGAVQQSRALESTTPAPAFEKIPKHLNFAHALPAPAQHALPASHAVTIQHVRTTPTFITSFVLPKTNSFHGTAPRMRTMHSGNVALNGMLMAADVCSKMTHTIPTQHWTRPRIAQPAAPQEPLSADKKLAVDVLLAGLEPTNQVVTKKSGTGVLRWFKF
jgi:hypothetical protein